MPLPSWPATLPQLRGAQQSGGTDSLYEPPLVTEMEDGPPRQRRRKLYLETPLMMVLDLTPAQAETFRVFYRDTLNVGASPFTGPVVLISRNVGTRTCRIDGRVSLKPYGGQMWRAAFTLAVRDW